VLLSSGDSFRHLIQKPRSQLGFVTYLLNYLRIKNSEPLHVSSITCSSSGGASQAALGILRAEISRYLKVLMYIFIKAKDILLKYKIFVSKISLC
jgi:hypothetical protein